MKKQNLKKFNFLKLSLGLPKFSVKTIFLIFTIALVLVQVYNGYEVYLLVEKVFSLFNQVTNVKIEVSNLSFLSEFYVALHDAQPKLFINSKSLKLLAKGSKKIPIVLLYAFFVLVLFNYFSQENFEMFFYLKTGAHHILIHKLLHYLQHQKHCKWYDLICRINKVKRYFKN